MINRLEASNTQFDSEQLGRNSVERVMRLINYDTFAGVIEDLSEGERFSKEDSMGGDVIFTLSPQMCALLGYGELSVEVKSCEERVEWFWHQELKFHKGFGKWINRHQMVINGQWSDNSIIADFISQWLALEGLSEDPERAVIFLALFPQEVVDIYRASHVGISGYRRELVEQILETKYKQEEKKARKRGQSRNFRVTRSGWVNGRGSSDIAYEEMN